MHGPCRISRVNEGRECFPCERKHRPSKREGPSEKFLRERLQLTVRQQIRKQRSRRWSASEDLIATNAGQEDAIAVFAEVLRENRNRVLLSGIGGDEVLGGAPSPAPLLADLLTHGQLQSLSKELLAWALALRRPVFSLAWETLATFVYAGNATRSVHPPGWLCSSSSNGNASAVRGYPRRTRFFGPRPSFQENLGTIEALRRQLSCYPLSAEPSYQKLYPYLDRDLVEF